MPKAEPIIDRLFRKRSIDPVTNCWNFTGAKTWNGYGNIKWNRKMQRTNRVSAALFLGFDINSPLKVLHSCDNPSCFNPSHLWIGTMQDNVTDCLNKKRRIAAKGEACGSTKLSEPQVRIIKNLIKQGVPCTEIAQKFKVTKECIYLILHNKTWRHIKDF